MANTIVCIFCLYDEYHEAAITENLKLPTGQCKSSGELQALITQITSLTNPLKFLRSYQQS
jgi:hypothetical protein